METIGTTRGPFDPEADAEDVPRANGVYVPGEPDPERAAVCPDCGFPTVWELQDTHEIGGERFSERLQVCDIACGWTWNAEHGDFHAFGLRDGRSCPILNLCVEDWGGGA